LQKPKPKRTPFLAILAGTPFLAIFAGMLVLFALWFLVRR
jgi:hypothetical protein